MQGIEENNKEVFPPVYLVIMGIGAALVLQGLVPQALSALTQQWGAFHTSDTYAKLNLLVTQTIAFGLCALVFMGGLNALGFRKVALVLWALAGGIAIVALPIIQYLALDADSFQLPAAFVEVEQALENLEAQAATMIKRLLANQLALNLLVMGVIPGVMEEAFFRGFIQKNFHKQLNAHLAIWLTAFLFSFIHFQVYGFVPRMLLGALYGYLTYWSGSLFPAVFAHFLNNAINVGVAYGALNGTIAPEWADDNPAIPAWFALGSLVLTCVLLYAFYRFSKHKA